MSVFRITILVLVIAAAAFVAGCSDDTTEVTEMYRFPLDNLDGVLTRSNISIDDGISSDGSGSLRIAADRAGTFPLFEVTGCDVDDARLIYEARVRTENASGPVYLEMWCHFPGQGEFFSRDLASPVMGSVDWITEETIFLLRSGQKPDRVKLNIVISGPGTVWVDDVRLLKAPLG